jgi:hypothetical protein
MEVYTRETWPERWAEAQHNLAGVLLGRAEAATGDAKTALTAEAAAAFRSVLTVYTREAFPDDWARTHHNLGRVLQDQADASEGAERTRLLADASASLLNALTVYKRDAFPDNWGKTRLFTIQCHTPTFGIRNRVEVVEFRLGFSTMKSHGTGCPCASGKHSR